MSDSQGTDEVDGGKHGVARDQGDAATRAQADGDDQKASDLVDAALHADPDGLANSLAQDPDGPAFEADRGTASDAEVAAISRTIEPGAGSPSRADIGGSGSGADTADE